MNTGSVLDCSSAVATGNTTNPVSKLRILFVKKCHRQRWIESTGVIDGDEGSVKFSGVVDGEEGRVVSIGVLYKGWVAACSTKEEFGVMEGLEICLFKPWSSELRGGVYILLRVQPMIKHLTAVVYRNLANFTRFEGFGIALFLSRQHITFIEFLEELIDHTWYFTSTNA